MPFNYTALDFLLSRLDCNPGRLHRRIRDEVGVEIPESQLAEWAKGRNLGKITTKQIDAFDQYARRNGHDLSFYQPAPMSFRQLREHYAQSGEGTLLLINPVGSVYAPPRVRSRLVTLGINTIEDLCNQTASSLQGHNFGASSLKWVEDFLSKQGLMLSKE